MSKSKLCQRGEGVKIVGSIFADGEVSSFFDAKSLRQTSCGYRVINFQSLDFLSCAYSRLDFDLPQLEIHIAIRPGSPASNCRLTVRHTRT